MSLLLALTGSSGGASGSIDWTEDGDTTTATATVLLATDIVWTESDDVTSIEGTVTESQAIEKKIGGDDVPRAEIWTKRKGKKKDDEALEQFIKAQYDQITGKTPAQVAEILVADYEDEDEEILLLMVS